MDVVQKGLRDEFNSLHDAFISEWDRAMETGDTEQLEHFYAKTYFVTFLGEPGAKPNKSYRASLRLQFSRMNCMPSKQEGWFRTLSQAKGG